MCLHKVYLLKEISDVNGSKIVFEHFKENFKAHASR